MKKWTLPLFASLCITKLWAAEAKIEERKDAPAHTETPYTSLRVKDLERKKILLSNNPAEYYLLSGILKGHEAVLSKIERFKKAIVQHQFNALEYIERPHMPTKTNIKDFYKASARLMALTNNPKHSWVIYAPYTQHLFWDYVLLLEKAKKPTTLMLSFSTLPEKLFTVINEDEIDRAHFQDMFRRAFLACTILESSEEIHAAIKRIIKYFQERQGKKAIMQRAAHEIYGVTLNDYSEVDKPLEEIYLGAQQIYSDVRIFNTIKQAIQLYDNVQEKLLSSGQHYKLTELKIALAELHQSNSYEEACKIYEEIQTKYNEKDKVKKD